MECTCDGGFSSLCSCGGKTCRCGKSGKCSSCDAKTKHICGETAYCGDHMTKLQKRDLPFNRDEYEIVRGPVVDAFEYKRGGVSVSIDRGFLDAVCENHNTKFSRTGDLSPLVIGHTIDGAQEHDQPQKVGYLHNWAVEPWVNPDGVKTSAAFADHYIQKQNTIVVAGAKLQLTAAEVLDRWPRRSGEVWFGSKTIDPHCFLGATAPERDLGILRLAANGDSGFTYTSPGRLSMQPEQAVNELPIVKEMQGQVQQMAQMIEALQEAMQTQQETLEAMQAAQAAMQSGPGAQLQDGNPEDFEALLQQLGVQGGGGAQGDPDAAPSQPAQPAQMKKEDPMPTPAPVAEVTPVAPSPAELEVKKLQRELDVIRLTKRIETLRLEKGVDLDPADTVLIEDLLSQPADMADRYFVRLEKGPKVPGFVTKGLQEALASEAAPEPKKVKGAEDTAKIIKLAKDKGIKYEEAATELGFIPGV